MRPHINYVLTVHFVCAANTAINWVLFSVMRTEEQRGILSTNFVTTARTEVILVGGSLNVV